jgi:protein-tyrosine phosphatase
MKPFAAREAGPVLRGAPNFRDLGGLASTQGGRVRPGRVFRSGHLGELHPQDLVLLQKHFPGGARVIDLRSSAERGAGGCGLPGSVVHSLPVRPTVAARLLERQAAGATLTGEMAAHFMCDAYRGFVADARSQLRAFLGHVLEEDGAPIVVHCHAGKDRTGFMAALLLSALEVPRAAILEDYLHTNARVPPRLTGRFAPDVMRVLTTVRAEFLQAAFDQVDREFGSCETYLLAGVGLSGEQLGHLRARLLAREP